MAALLARGRTVAEIAGELRLTRSTVCYHKRRLGFAIDERFARRYDWSRIQDYYDEGHSMRECQLRFGFSRESWHSAVKRGAVVPRVNGFPLHTLLVRGSRYKRGHLKRRLIEAGLKENRCERCGVTEWRDKPLTMALHHRNGDRYDNRLGNLEFLCPNCHSQTSNFSGRNVRRGRARDDGPEPERPARSVGALGRHLPVIGDVA